MLKQCPSASPQGSAACSPWGVRPWVTLSKSHSKLTAHSLPEFWCLGSCQSLDLGFPSLIVFADFSCDCKDHHFPDEAQAKVQLDQSWQPRRFLGVPRQDLGEESFIHAWKQRALSAFPLPQGPSPPQQSPSRSFQTQLRGLPPPASLPNMS